jgi:hypothetical protein
LKGTQSFGFDVSSTDVGRIILPNPFSINVISSIPDNLYPDSKVSEESDPQSSKQFSSKNSTERGITISINVISPNACFPIRDNIDPGSNVTDERNMQKAKHSSLNISTDEGITI